MMDIDEYYDFGEINNLILDDPDEFAGFDELDEIIDFCDFEIGDINEAIIIPDRHLNEEQYFEKNINWL